MGFLWYHCIVRLGSRKVPVLDPPESRRKVFSNHTFRSSINSGLNAYAAYSLNHTHILCPRHNLVGPSWLPCSRSCGPTEELNLQMWPYFNYEQRSIFLVSNVPGWNPTRQRSEMRHNERTVAGVLRRTSACINIGEISDLSAADSPEAIITGSASSRSVHKSYQILLYLLCQSTLNRSVIVLGSWNDALNTTQLSTNDTRLQDVKCSPQQINTCKYMGTQVHLMYKDQYAKSKR